MMKLLLSFSFSVALSVMMMAQGQIVSAELVSSATQQQLSASYPIFNFLTDVDAYSVTYTSVDVHGDPDTLSGLVVIPLDSTYIYPRIAYMHGTVTDRWAVPSQMSGEGGITMAFSGMGSVAVAPDYPGLGTGRGFHPYVHAESQARSGIDLLRAASELASNLGVLINDGLLMAGYSQGGHGALGLHKEIEEKYAAEFTVDASAPMSGPYSLSDIMLQNTLDSNVYFFPSYLVNITVGMQTAYGTIYDSLEQIFESAFIADIEQFISEEISLTDLNEVLISKLIQQEGASIPLFIFKESFRQEIINDPENNPLIIALKDNDLVDWAPQAPTRLYYCIGDDQVPYQNSLVAEAGLIAAGGTNVQAIESGGIIFDHGACATPAFFGASNHLLFHQELGMVSSLISQFSKPEKLAVFPNPVFDILNMADLEELETFQSYRVLTPDGRVLIQQPLNGRRSFDLSQLQDGFYIIMLLDENLQRTKRATFIKVSN
ncbi:MAG: T9SS type A sorting domain-containing protein [Saprospiraceae bacterium]|nr:T9SS type A sorting domain-containing protein [Saprospiraceae bacterium]